MNSMTYLYLYTAFHANLKFSSIPEKHYSLILDRCFWPLLDILRDYKCNIGFEMPASTLEILHDIDKEFTDTLKNYLNKERCELIGSGYSQAIFPLIPRKVNLMNLLQGNKVYKNIIGIIPITAYANEQTYSSGLIELYKKAGYKNLIMDWDNATKYNHFNQDYKYKPNIVVGTNNEKMNIIWNNSISFQKFQRYVHGTLDFKRYMQYLESQHSKDEDRSFLLYGNDIEIFDYRPGRGSFLHLGKEKLDEFDRIRKLFDHLEKNERIKLITPNQVINMFKPKNEVKLESPEYPILTKKQDKYNVTRWAVCGRDNSKINTQCYKIFRNIEQIECLNELVSHTCKRSKIDTLWNRLTDLWSSDFRTHTTDEKYMRFRNSMGATIESVSEMYKKLINQIPIKDDFILINPNNLEWNEPFEFKLQFERGLFNKDILILLDENEVATQQEETEFYRDGSIRATKIVIIPSIKQKAVAQGKILIKNKPDTRNVIINHTEESVKTPEVEIRLSSLRGASIKKLIFPKISDQHFMGELSHGYFDDVSYSADWYSGHTIIYDRSGKKYTDLSKTELFYPPLEKCPIRVPIKCRINLPIGTLYKTYFIYVDLPRIDLVYDFNLNAVLPLSFRLGITTINPKIFNIENLRYTTINGGYNPESFYLKGKELDQNRPVSQNVSTHHCLGATEGWVDISDNEKGMMINAKKSQYYSVPLIQYKEIKDSFFLRVYGSICEMDDTSETLLKGHNKISFSFIGHRNNPKKSRNVCNNTNSGLILKLKY